VDVNAVKERPGNLRDVALNEWRCASALARGIVEEPARLWVISLRRKE